MEVGIFIQKRESISGAKLYEEINKQIIYELYIEDMKEYQFLYIPGQIGFKHATLPTALVCPF